MQEDRRSLQSGLFPVNIGGVRVAGAGCGSGRLGGALEAEATHPHVGEGVGE